MSLNIPSHTKPMFLFDQWFSASKNAGVIEPNAMTLSTSNGSGDLLSRVVLLKNHGDQGFCFFTNYESQKGKNLVANPKAALNFHWRQPEHRQVRIVGTVIKSTPQESEDYFQSRARGSRIAAWASPQSQAITDRTALDELIDQSEKKFHGKDIPCPPHWGGFWVQPLSIEFWQEQEFRRHDRFRFVRKDLESPWSMERLAP